MACEDGSEFHAPGPTLGHVTMPGAIWPCCPQGQYRVRERWGNGAGVAAVTTPSEPRLLPACRLRNRQALSVNVKNSKAPTGDRSNFQALAMAALPRRPHRSQRHQVPLVLGI